MKKFYALFLLTVCLIILLFAITGIGMGAVFIYSVFERCIEAEGPFSIYDYMTHFYMFLSFVTFILLCIRAVYLFYKIIIKRERPRRRGYFDHINPNSQKNGTNF